MRDTDIVFGYFSSQGIAALCSPPSDGLREAILTDLFIHRIMNGDAVHRLQLQIWMLMSNEAEATSNARARWEPVAIGTSMHFGGVKHFLGVDVKTGRPYWYSSESFGKYAGRNGLSQGY